MSGADLARVEIKTRAALRAWLMRHHAQPNSIWLVTYKKGKGPHVPYDAIVEEALCFGWVDSLPRALDADRTMLRLSPRKPKSGWSGVNKARIEKLIASERMAPPGLAAIDTAKRNGAWTKLDSASALIVPRDLAAALKADAAAAKNFAAFPPSTRRAILEWISAAKKPETRAARIAACIRDAARDIRVNQPRQPKRARRSP